MLIFDGYSSGNSVEKNYRKRCFSFLNYGSTRKIVKWNFLGQINHTVPFFSEPDFLGLRVNHPHVNTFILRSFCVSTSFFLSIFL